jgi:integrase
LLRKFSEGRVNGRVRQINIGRWPDVSVVKARKRALELKSSIADGADLTAEGDAVKSTFAALAARYVEYVKAPDKRTWAQDEKILARYFKSWSARRLCDVTRDDVVQLHERIGKAHGKYAANRAIALLRAMFNSAIDWKLIIGENPAARVKFFKKTKREQFLAPDELRRVNAALMKEPNEYWRAYFPLVRMLGPRRGELLAAKWKYIDLQQKTWHLPMTKAERSHLLPLPEQAAPILESLPSCGNSEWVFPGAGKTGHLVEAKSAWQRIRNRAGVSDVRIHDLRRMLGSWLAAAGYGLSMIGKALNHSSPTSTAI